MFTTGSKLFLGGTLLAAVGAVLYGLLQGGALGTVGLVFAAVALAVLAAVSLITRDANVSAMDVSALHRTEAADVTPNGTMWPAVAGLGLLLVVAGLVTYPVVFVFGLLALVAAAAEWMVAAWSDRATSDPEINQVARGRIAHPLEFPILAAVGLGIVVYSFSRIMLFLSKSGGPVAFGTIALLVLVAGFMVAFKPELRAGALGAVAIIAALGLVAGGVVSALQGERHIEAHETTGDLAASSSCDTSEETHADTRASQTVAAKANTAGEIILRADGTLVAHPVDLPEASSIVLMRNNPTNLLFRNHSDEARRLLLNGGMVPSDPADPTSDPVPAQFCTALVEDGGTQLLTFVLRNTTVSQESPMTLTVPGVEGAQVEVVVP